MGAPKGNTNALVHGFYAKALRRAQKYDLEVARGLEDLSEEIAALRVKLQEVLKTAPEDYRLQIEVARGLARLVATQYQLSPKAKDSLSDAITAVLTEVGGALGLGEPRSE